MSQAIPKTSLAKRLLTIFLACLITLTALSTPVVKAAGANDRVRIFLSLGKGKQLTSMDLNGITLKEKDIQFLGIYLSNFYIPFVTEFGLGSADDEADTMKQGMLTALTSSLQFDNTTAQSFITVVRKYIQNSSVALKFGWSANGDGTGIEMDATNTPCTYMNLLSGISGHFPVMANYVTADGGAADQITKIRDGSFKYGYLMNGSNPVFCFSLNCSEITPSTMALIKAMDESKPDLGYGFSGLDFLSSELNPSDNDALKNLANITDEAGLFAATNYGSPLAVSPFGDIFIVGNNHQTVMLPGCMNPFVWTPVDGSGNDIAPAGSAVNIINIRMLDEVNNNFGGGGVPLFTDTMGLGQTHEPAVGTTSGGNVGGSSSASGGQLLSSTKKELQIAQSDVPACPYHGALHVNAVPYINDAGNWECGPRSEAILKGYFRGINGVSVRSNGGTYYVTASYDDWKNLQNNANTQASRSTGDTQKGYTWIAQFAGNCAAKFMKDFSPTTSQVNNTGQDPTTDLVDENGDANHYVGVDASNSPLHAGLFDTSNLDTRVSNIKGCLNTVGINTLITQLMGATASLSQVPIVKGNKETTPPTIWWSWFTDDAGFHDISNSLKDYSEKTYPTSLGKVYTDINGFYGSYFSNPQGASLGGVNNKTLPFLCNFIMVDNVGAYTGDNSAAATPSPSAEASSDASAAPSPTAAATTPQASGTSDGSLDYETFPVVSYIAGDGGAASSLANVPKVTQSLNFSNMYADGNQTSSLAQVYQNAPSQLWIGIYLAYCEACLWDSTNKEATIGRIGYRANLSALPSLGDGDLDLSADGIDLEQKTIMDWLYYLLHPTAGFEYFKQWLGNKLKQFFLGIHEDMTGTEGVGALAGSTRYLSFTGYVTTPELSDMEWTSTMLTGYYNILVYIIIVVIFIMICFAVTGTLTIQRAVAGMLLFTGCAFLPPLAINGVIFGSNEIANRMYGDKLTYWALVQHQGYSSKLEEFATADSYSNYLKYLYNANNDASIDSVNGNNAVNVRWQAPKKMASLMLDQNAKQVFNGDMLKMMNGLFEKTFSGESYLDDDDALYMYRSYTDLANFSHYIYKGLSTGIQGYKSSPDLSSWPADMRLRWQVAAGSFQNDRASGYSNYNANNSDDINDALRLIIPLSSRIYADAVRDANVQAATTDSYIGIDSRAFNFSLPIFSHSEMSFLESLAQEEFDPGNINGHTYVNEDYAGLAAYGLMSENPFYYFSWLLYDNGLSCEDGSTGGYKDLILSSGKNAFFYNVGLDGNISGDMNGELKDYMDLKSMFTYVIPYLKLGNDVVREWDELYGLKFYTDVSLEEGHEADYTDDPEALAKYHVNLTISRLYNIYCPWLDLMYDCSYAQPETISIYGQKFTVDDPLDPQSYPDERPMVFSRSEMYAWGLDEGDLTQVELRIILTQDDAQQSLVNLLNYYNFNDSVMDTAAAMQMAFAFNNNFSEINAIGENHVIYPQNYELKNFSYDVYLRMILANATGEDLVVTGGGDFYEVIVNNCSIITVLFILLSDMMCMYIIPALKICFVVLVFALSFIMIMACAIAEKGRLYKTLLQLLECVGKPLLLFFLASVGFAWLICVMMGEGLTGVTGTMGMSVSFGDPTMTLVVVDLINIALIFCLVKIVIMMWRDLKKYGTMVGTAIAGAVTGTFAMAGNALKNAFGGSSSETGGEANGGTSISSGGGGVSQGGDTTNVNIGGDSSSSNSNSSGGPTISGSSTKLSSESAATAGKAPEVDSSPQKEQNTGNSDKYDEKVDQGKDKINASDEGKDKTPSDRNNLGGSSSNAARSTPRKQDGDSSRSGDRNNLGSSGSTDRNNLGGSARSTPRSGGNNSGKNDRNQM